MMQTDLMRSLKTFISSYGINIPRVVATLISGYSGWLVFEFLASVSAPPGGIWQLQPADRSRNESPVNVDLIVDAHLFGEAPSDNPLEAGVQPQELPLNLSLIGILAYKHEGAKSLAIIESIGDEGRVFSEGQEVTSGVTLAHILSRSVELDSNGRSISLTLESDESEAVADDYTAGETTQLKEKRTDNMKALIAIRDAIARERDQSVTWIRFQPNDVNKRIHGYRIYPGRDRTLFDASDLLPGDLVTNINGIDVDDSSKINVIIDQLLKSPDLLITVERGSTFKNFKIHL